MKKSSPEVAWDVLVIGGGPAGMMAAATAAARGKHVLLLEKNSRVGKKLLITGGGRCNILNNKPEVQVLAAEYKDAKKFLYSTFSQHAATESIDWFTTRGVTLVEENDGRLFPSTNTAQTVWDILVTEMKAHQVTVRSHAVVTAITKPTQHPFEVYVQGGDVVLAHRVVLATGGMARPETGSTGDGFRFLSSLGHTVLQNNFALVPITVAEAWVAPLAGVSVRDVKVTIFADGKKQQAAVGKMLFTHVGLSGPLILNHSKKIGELLAHSVVTLTIDLLPMHDAGALKQILATHFKNASNKKIKNVLGECIPSAMAGPLLVCAGVDGDTPVHSVRTTDRTKIAQLIKALPLTVTGLLGPDKAVVSAGGVVPTEINFKTMESRLVPGLFVVGDVINIDRPSGGYSLQLCWSTGYVAGNNV